MYRLCDVFEIPEEMRYYNIMVFDKEEALCIFLKRFAHPCRYQDLMLRIVQRALPQLCMISNQVQNIYENWVFLLRNINQSWLSRRNLEVLRKLYIPKEPHLIIAGGSQMVQQDLSPWAKSKVCDITNDFVALNFNQLLHPMAA